MEAGRELDALIAEKVMGWKVKLDPGEDHLIYSRRWEEPDGNWCREDDIPHYSTEISSAWEVLEKFPEVQRLERNWIADKSLWICELGINQESSSALGRTAPHAICLAALKAVEGE